MEARVTSLTPYGFTQILRGFCIDNLCSPTRGSGILAKKKNSHIWLGYYVWVRNKRLSCFQSNITRKWNLSTGVPYICNNNYYNDKLGPVSRTFVKRERDRERERECVCVCVWERERERERENYNYRGQTDRQSQRWRGVETQIQTKRDLGRETERERERERGGGGESEREREREGEVWIVRERGERGFNCESQRERERFQ